MATHCANIVGKNRCFVTKKLFVCLVRKCTNTAANSADSEEFRVLDLKKTNNRISQFSQRRKRIQNVFPPRTTRMSVEQDWTNVWPGPRTFHPATVPLPIRQGINKLGAAPDKYANIELMKIPNFLHLTPPAIKKHCDALKKFCTPWPDNLKTDEDCLKHFPLEVIHSHYCHSSPSIRNPLSRITTIKFPLNRLQLDVHARDKFLRLVADRYDETTGIVTIVADKCPLRQQNYDYALYLLTAVYFESWKYEPWEKEKAEADLEYYDWINSQSRKNLEYIFDKTSVAFDVESPIVTSHRDAVVAVFDEGENDYNLKKYKEVCQKILFPNMKSDGL